MTGGGRGPSEESRVRDTLKDPHGLQGCQLVKKIVTVLLCISHQNECTTTVLIVDT